MIASTTKPSNDNFRIRLGQQDYPNPAGRPRAAAGAVPMSRRASEDGGPGTGIPTAPDGEEPHRFPESAPSVSAGRAAQPPSAPASPRKASLPRGLRRGHGDRQPWSPIRSRRRAFHPGPFAAAGIAICIIALIVLSAAWTVSALLYPDVWTAANVSGALSAGVW